MHYKYSIPSLILLILWPVALLPQITAKKARLAFSVAVKNNSNIDRPGEVVSLPLSMLPADLLKSKTGIAVLENGKQLHTSIVKRSAGKGEYLTFITDMKAGEEKKFTIEKKAFTLPKTSKLTQAWLGVKTGYELRNGFYTQGRFEKSSGTTVNKDHFAHDALYQYEGPGWESDKIAYRLYLDSRNRTDIFVKKTAAMVMNEVGINDLVSDSKESYTRMQEWGMDMFKVGASLGIGSFAAFINGKPVTVSETDSVRCLVSADGDYFSEIYLKYFGWKAGASTNNLEAWLSINAHSRLTRVELNNSGELLNFCTGLAKHEGTESFMSMPVKKGRWGYVAQWGKQSLTGDKMGLAVFFCKSNDPAAAEDSSSSIVVLKPVKGELEYYFAACWEGEPGGITTREEFTDYLASTVKKLDSPLEIELISK